MAMTQLDIQALNILKQAGQPIDDATCCLAHALDAIKVALTQRRPTQVSDQQDQQADANRYRWLKSYRAPDVRFRVNGVHMRIPPEQMDAMVDAAMARDREAA